MALMRFLFKFIIRIILSGAALYAAGALLPGFIIPPDLEYLFLGGLTLALINTFIRPILKIVSFPFIILTFGLFHVVINIAILLLADYFLAELAIQDFWTLFLASIIIGIANAII